MNDIRSNIKKIMSERGISQRELALKSGMSYQNLGAALRGERNFPLRSSLLIERALGIKEGYIERRQTEERIKKESLAIGLSAYEQGKMAILEKVKSNGGLWSFDGIPENLDDDSIIEAGLRHLDFEDMDLIFGIWPQARIKKIWKKRLVSEGKRMNTLNTLLGILFFDINNIDKYLEKHVHC